MPFRQLKSFLKILIGVQYEKIRGFFLENGKKKPPPMGAAQTVEKPCHCEAVRTLPWQSPEFSNILDPKPAAFTSIRGIPTPLKRTGSE